MHGEMTSWVFEDSIVLRSVTHEGDPTWFAGPDVARALGYRDATDALRTLDNDERGTHNIRIPTGTATITVVSEPGLYRCVLQRHDVKKIPDEVRARIARFQRWVFHEVLPAIRKTGRYEMPRADTQDPPRFSPAVEDARKESLRTRRQLVSEARQTHGTNVAREMWFYLDMPITPSMLKPAAPELPFTYTAVKHEAEPEKEEAA